jgi:putative redox protein
MDLITVEKQENGAFAFSVRQHEVSSDMSAADGGQDLGPSPVELVGGALASCIAIMVQRYCDAKDYNDGQVEVSLTMELADDPKRVEAFVIDVELPADVPENRMAAVAKIAEHCPVHATLSNAPRVDIDFTRGDT